MASSARYARCAITNTVLPIISMNAARRVQLMMVDMSAMTRVNLLNLNWHMALRYLQGSG
jgi:hypothetical protein